MQSTENLKPIENRNFTFFEKIEQGIEEKKYSTASDNFNVSMDFLSNDADVKVIEEAFKVLEKLIDSIKSFQKIEESFKKLLTISADRHFRTHQQRLAFKMAAWHYQKGKKETEEPFPHLISATHYIAKAILIQETSPPIDGLAARIFRTVSVNLSSFKDKLALAISSANKIQVFQLIDDLKSRLEHLCCDEEKNAYIKLFYKQIRTLYSETFALRGQERIEACGLNSLNSEIQARLLEKTLAPPCLITTGYRQKLAAFRQQFKELYRQCPSLAKPEEVKILQTEVSTLFIAFIRELVQDAFTIIGDPPCHYDLRAMGSLAREEICPYSDLEWCILIETIEHRPYFIRVARFIEVQFIGFGEDPAMTLPVFSCIGKKHRSGLHVDTGSNPAILHDLISTPELLAKKQTEIDYQPNSLPNTLRKTISLKQSTPLLFENYQKSLQDYLEEKPGEETWRHLHAFQLLNARLKNYEEAWSLPFKDNLINIKGGYTELLYHLLNDLSLYFSIDDGNTLDLIDKLVKKGFFSLDSGFLLKEAVSAIYLTRVGLHLDYGEQKEVAHRFSSGEKEIEHSPIVLEEHINRQLEKIYWLVLRPLYRKLKSCLSEDFVFLEPHFQQLDLLKCAFFEELHPDTIMDLKPVIVHLVHHLATKSLSLSIEEQEGHFALHEPYYKYLSTMTSAEPLRQTYLKVLELYADHPIIAKLIDFWAAIPNPSGVRQSHRMENEQLQAAILEMTTPQPESPTSVFIRCPTAPQGRYLRQEVIDQILTDKGDLKRMYNNSAHNVAFVSYGGYHLHFKQKPIHPLMEYAVHSLAGRMGGHLTPPTELARIEVQGKMYPILISKTVPGKALGETDEIEPTSLTWGCLCALLTLPGDGRFPNYLIESETNRLFSVDNDISFVEPVTQGLFGRHNIHFASALFCLNSQPLNPGVLEIFIHLDPTLILHSWIEELIEKDNLYHQMQLFTIEEEKRFYEENKEDRFKGTLLLRSGTVTTLLIQFHYLQNSLRLALKERKTLYPLDLLSHLITLRDHQKQALNQWVYQDYKKARDSSSSPKRRLHKALNRSIEVSMTSSQSDGISFGKPPTIEEIQKREEYSPEKAQGELFAFTLSDGMAGVAIGQSQGKEYVKANFKKMVKHGVPDLERQRLVLKALTFLVGRKHPKPSGITLANCAVLDLASLEPFLHADLESLNLSGCPIIKEETRSKKLKSNVLVLKNYISIGVRS